MNAIFKAEKLASGLNGLPEGLGSESYSVISQGRRGFVACPDGYPEITVKVFSDAGGEGACTYEFETINYARNTSAKPLRSLPLAYAFGHLSVGSESLPAIALETARGTTMREAGYGRLTRSDVPRRQSESELFGFALSLADTLHSLRSHYIHCRVRTPDTVIVRRGSGFEPEIGGVHIMLSDVMSGGFSAPTETGQDDATMDALPFTPPELMKPVEDIVWANADHVDMWVYGCLVCYAAVGRFWDDWMDGRRDEDLSGSELAMAQALKRSALDLRSLVPGYFARPGAFPLAECVADVVMACTNAEPLLRPDIVSVKSVLEEATGARWSANATMPFRH